MPLCALVNVSTRAVSALLVCILVIYHCAVYLWNVNYIILVHTQKSPTGSELILASCTVILAIHLSWCAV